MNAVIKKKSRFWRWVMLLVIGLTAIGFVGNSIMEAKLAELRLSDPKAYLSELEKLSNTERWLAELKELDPGRYKTEMVERIRIEKAERAAKYQADRDLKRSGLLCLDSWDGSHRGLKKVVIGALRDPDSFEHIETRIAPWNSKQEHNIIMKYRARNGFGGLTVELASGTTLAKTCLLRTWTNN